VELAVMAVFYVGVQYLIGGGRLVDALLPVTMIGFVTYIVAYLLLVKVVAGILEEMHTGTLEQVHLSPLPPWLPAVGLLVAVLVEAALVAGLVAAGFVIALHLEFAGLKWDMLVPAALTLLDIAGFALLMGGIALTLTTIGAINHVVYSLVGLLNGSYVPVVLRQILVDDRTLAATWSNGSLGWTLMHAVAMQLLGWTVYQWQVRRGLREGRLGPR
jgi:ABC-2 type transport system permease protein